MEALTAEQSAIGKEIERISSVYANDAPEKKTLTYLNEKLLTLNALWDKFMENDKLIKQSSGGQSSHPYFTKDHYNFVKRGYKSLSSEIIELINHIKTSSDSAAGSTPKQLSANTGAISKTQKIPLQTNQNENNRQMEVILNESLKHAIRKYKFAVQSLKNILINTKTSGQSESYYQVKMESITKHWKQIEEGHYSIHEQTDDTVIDEYNFEEYLQLELQVQDTLVNLRENCHNNSNNTTSNHSNQSLIKLPKIVLPKFDGDHLKWQQFYDLFNQMVHNQTMGNAQKMWYLKMNVTGEAEKIIRHLQISDNNYEIAWNVLKNRYENKRLQVTALLDQLMTQPALQQESAVALKRLHDTTKECILRLENLC